MTRLLIVEDEKNQREDLRDLMLGKGWEVEVACSVSEAELRLAARAFDVVLTDVVLEGGPPGTDLIRRCGEARVVMMSKFGCVNSAVDAMKLGAVDYITKPVDPEELFARLTRAAPPPTAAGIEDMLLGECGTMRIVQDRVRRIAATDLSVLVVGESGTGKRLVARAIHEQSARRAGPFVAFSCAATDENLVTRELLGHESGAVPGGTTARAGLFELANGGTVFLDEVGGLSSFAQERLLGVLRNRAVQRVGSARTERIDVRVVAATRMDLAARMQEQRFSNELYYYLKDFEARLPPLRERGDDLLILARRAVSKGCAGKDGSQVRLSPAVCEALRAYVWPGNVRELESALKSALVLCDGEEIGVQHLPPEIGAQLLPQEVGSQLIPKEVGGRPRPEPGSHDDHVMRVIVANQDLPTDRQEVGVRLPHEVSEQLLREKVGRKLLPKPGSSDDYFMRVVVAYQDDESDEKLAKRLCCSRATILRFRETWEILNPRGR